MARQFCQMESLNTTYQNAISLELKFFTFVFYTKLIFPLLFELNNFFQLFSEIFKALYLKQESKNQLGVENKSCPKFYFTSPENIFQWSNIFDIEIQNFQTEIFSKGLSKKF